MADRQLILYSRTVPCPDCDRAKAILTENALAHTEVMIDLDAEACARVERWTGFRSVPTLVVAWPGELVPFSKPRPLEPGRSPRGVDRGPLITEPDAIGLTAQGFLSAV